jgi:hypothetical protein
MVMASQIATIDQYRRGVGRPSGVLALAPASVSELAVCIVA